MLGTKVGEPLFLPQWEMNHVDNLVLPIRATSAYTIPINKSVLLVPSLEHPPFHPHMTCSLQHCCGPERIDRCTAEIHLIIWHPAESSHS